MENKYDNRLELFKWMHEDLMLEGLELLVYAVIYNEVEATPKDLYEWTGLSGNQLQRVIKTLEADKYICHITTNDDRKYIFYINEDLLF